MAIGSAAVPERTPKVAELVAAELRRQVITGELTEDDTLPSEGELLRRFEVSRPTLREAFRILESERLISVRRGAHGGAHVHPPNSDVAARYAGLVLQHRAVRLSDVYEARVEIEGPLARLVTQRCGAEGLARLRAELDAAAAVIDDPVAYLERDAAFHLLVAELGGNETLGLVVAMVWHIVGAANQRYLESNPIERDLAGAVAVQNAHAEFVGLVAAGDAAAAEASWRRHLADIGQELLRGHRATTVVELLS